MKHTVCSKLWTDLNIRIPVKHVINCCKRDAYPQFTPEEIRSKGKDILTKNDILMKDKKFWTKNNQLPSGCSQCAKNFPNGYYGAHNEWINREWDKRELKHLADKDLTRLYEFMLGNTCNMACMYCNKDYSNTWAQITGEKSPSVDNEWQDAILEAAFDHLKHNDNDNLTFNFVGGEPLLEPNIFNVLEEITSIMSKKSSKGHTVLITTNLTIKPKVLDNFLSIVRRYPQFRWCVCPSVDAIGTYGENIRSLMDWNLFETNAQTLLNDKNISSVNFLPSINALSIPQHKELCSWILRNTTKAKRTPDQWDIGDNAVYSPMAMSVKVLPKTYIKHLDRAIGLIKPFKPRHANFLETLKNQVGQNRSEKDLIDARRWYEMHGKIKNVNYFELFPMLEKIL